LVDDPPVNHGQVAVKTADEAGPFHGWCLI